MGSFRDVILEHWQACLFIFSLVLFLPMFFRLPVGADSFAYLSFVCGSSFLGQFIFAAPFFALLPCNLFFVSCFMFFLFFGSVYFISRIGKLLFPNGALAGFFALGLSPIILFFFSNFENDQVGYFLMLVSSFYFFRLVLWFNVEFKGGFPVRVRDSVIYYFKSLYFVFVNGWFLWVPFLFFFVGSFLFWKGVSYFFLGVLCLWFVSVPFVAFAVLFLFTEFISGFHSSQLVGENFPFTGFVTFFFLFIGVFGLWFERHRDALFMVTCYLLFLGLVFSKWVFLGVPFLAFGVVLAFNRFKFLSHLLYYCLIFGCVFSFMLFTFFPSYDLLDAVHDSVVVVGDSPVHVDWSYGYLFFYFGHPVGEFGGSQITPLDGFVFSDVNRSCSVVRDYNFWKLYYC